MQMRTLLRQKVSAATVDIICCHRKVHGWSCNPQYCLLLAQRLRLYPQILVCTWMQVCTLLRQNVILQLQLSNCGFDRSNNTPLAHLQGFLHKNGCGFHVFSTLRRPPLISVPSQLALSFITCALLWRRTECLVFWMREIFVLGGIQRWKHS